MRTKVLLAVFLLVNALVLVNLRVPLFLGEKSKGILAVVRTTICCFALRGQQVLGDRMVCFLPFESGGKCSLIGVLYIAFGGTQRSRLRECRFRLRLQLEQNGPILLYVDPA